MPQSLTAVSWSRCHGAECIRLAAAGTGLQVEVRPRHGMPGARPEGLASPRLDAAAGALLPAMAGQVVRDDADLCFLPRFGFVDGTSYAVTVDGAEVAVLSRPRRERPATTEVAGIWPTAAQVPRNLLRLYVLFSAAMSEGYAAGHVHITDGGGEPVPGALLPAEHELWDAARRRLTVLLDPARIKRGLAAHRAAGYPLRPGQPFRLLVDDGFRDAAGARLRAPAQRRYQVGEAERRRVEPAQWRLTAPAAGTTGPLMARFRRPLDHGLLGRCLRVARAGGQPVDGTGQPGPEEMSWQFRPIEEWAPGPYRLLVDPVLEDLAGNSVTRVFDRDLTSPAGEPRQAGPVAVAFWLGAAQRLRRISVPSP